MKIKVLLLTAMVMFMYGCQEEFNKPLEESAEVTGIVTNVSVENTPGGALITYSVPSDASLLYVLAELEGKNGKIRQFKSSQYKNTIQVDGIGDTEDYNVKLYTVNRSEVRSDPVDVQIKPLTPPFLKVFETVELMEDFGGVNIKFENETEADLAFVLYATDSLGDFSQYGTHYSKSKSGSYTYRGMKSENVQIGIFIKDRWENSSDTLITELTPLYEVMLAKPYEDITLDNDAILAAPSAYLQKRFLWDNDWSKVFDGAWYGSYRNMLTVDSNEGDPLHITFDLKVKTRLSRMRLNQYYRYTDRAPRIYEIWGHPGTFGPPAQNGSWDEWVLLARHENIKPSGLPSSQYSDEDKAAWLEGDNINFPTDISSMRYIRIKCLENWSGVLNFSIAEVTFWGGSNE